LPAALLRSKHNVLVTVPGDHRVTVIFNVVELAAIPDRPFREMGISVENLETGVSLGQRCDARGKQQKDQVFARGGARLYFDTTFDEYDVNCSGD
jgi:hypothetical protein